MVITVKKIEACSFNLTLSLLKDLFYCVNTSYPMDNCFTGRRDRSRQTPEKDVLYRIPAGPVRRVHSPGGASYFLFLSRHRDVIASFSFGAWRVKTCFLVLYRTHPFYFIFEVIQKLYLQPCHHQHKDEVHTDTLWLISTPIPSVHVVGTKG